MQGSRPDSASASLDLWLSPVYTVRTSEFDQRICTTPRLRVIHFLSVLGTKPAALKTHSQISGTFWVAKGKSWDEVEGLYSVSLDPGPHSWEKQTQGLDSCVLLSIQGYTRSPGSANLLGLDSGPALQGQKARVHRLPKDIGLSMDRCPGLPLNTSSVLGIMTPKCFAQVRPIIANSCPSSAASWNCLWVSRAPHKNPLSREDGLPRFPWSVPLFRGRQVAHPFCMLATKACRCQQKEQRI